MYLQYATKYSGADKSLARSGRKKVNISVRLAWISFGALPCWGTAWRPLGTDDVTAPWSGGLYRGADKSLARPGKKQANVSVRMVWISFGALLCKERKTWWQLASRCCWNRARPWHASEIVSFLVGLRTYQHPVNIDIIKCVHTVQYFNIFINVLKPNNCISGHGPVMAQVTAYSD